MSECGIGHDDLDQASIKQVDIGGEPSDAAAGKTLQHRIFQQSGGIFSGDFRVAELAAHGKDLGQPFDRRRVRLRRSCGMMAMNDVIMRASSGSFCARTPLALANCRSLNGLTWRTDMPAASNAHTAPLVPAFPQHSPPLLLTTAACGGLRSTPDCRPRRTSLHLSYSCASPFGPAMLVTQDPIRTSGACVLSIWDCAISACRTEPPAYRTQP